MSTNRRAAEVGLRYLMSAAQLRRAVDEHMVDAGASLARTKILQVLASHGPVKQARLAEELGQAARSITQAVETMERDDLVRRSPDPADGRAKVVIVTDEGLRALAAGEAAGNEVLLRIFRALDPGQLTALDEVLAVIDTQLR